MGTRSNRNIRNVIQNEWRNAFASANTVLFMTLFPVLILAQMFVIIWLVSRFVSPEVLSGTILSQGLAKIQAIMPQITSLAPVDKFKIFFYMQIPVYILLVPAMIANGLATFSIVEEKQTGTLEPLLATPVKTWELLLAKALSGTIPAVIVTWFCAGLCVLGVAIIGPSSLVKYLMTPAWLISLILVVPAVTLMSFLLGVIGSARAKDARSAQQLAVIIVFPIFGLVVIQLLGVIAYSPLILTLLGVMILLLDLLTLRMAVRLFRRESIVSKWK